MSKYPIALSYYIQFFSTVLKVNKAKWMEQYLGWEQCYSLDEATKPRLIVAHNMNALLINQQVGCKITCLSLDFHQ